LSSEDENVIHAISIIPVRNRLARLRFAERQGKRKGTGAIEPSVNEFFVFVWSPEPWVIADIELEAAPQPRGRECHGTP
jgi:hypothetical protein